MKERWILIWPLKKKSFLRCKDKRVTDHKDVPTREREREFTPVNNRQPHTLVRQSACRLRITRSFNPSSDQRPYFSISFAKHRLRQQQRRSSGESCDAAMAAPAFQFQRTFLPLISLTVIISPSVRLPPGPTRPIDDRCIYSGPTHTQTSVSI